MAPSPPTPALPPWSAVHENDAVGAVHRAVHDEVRVAVVHDTAHDGEVAGVVEATHPRLRDVRWRRNDDESTVLEYEHVGNRPAGRVGAPVQQGHVRQLGRTRRRRRRAGEHLADHFTRAVDGDRDRGVETGGSECREVDEFVGGRRRRGGRQSPRRRQRELTEGHDGTNGQNTDDLAQSGHRRTSPHRRHQPPKSNGARPDGLEPPEPDDPEPRRPRNQTTKNPDEPEPRRPGTPTRTTRG